MSTWTKNHRLKLTVARNDYYLRKAAAIGFMVAGAASHPTTSPILDVIQSAAMTATTVDVAGTPMRSPFA